MLSANCCSLNPDSSTSLPKRYQFILLNPRIRGNLPYANGVTVKQNSDIKRFRCIFCQILPAIAVADQGQLQSVLFDDGLDKFPDNVRPHKDDGNMTFVFNVSQFFLNLESNAVVLL